MLAVILERLDGLERRLDRKKTGTIKEHRRDETQAAMVVIAAPMLF